MELIENWRYVDCAGPASQRPIKDLPACTTQTVMRVVETPADATLGDYGTVLLLAIFVFPLALYMWAVLVNAAIWLSGADQKTPR